MLFKADQARWGDVGAGGSGNNAVLVVKTDEFLSELFGSRGKRFIDYTEKLWECVEMRLMVSMGIRKHRFGTEEG